MSEKKVLEITSAGMAITGYNGNFKALSGHVIPEYPLLRLKAEVAPENGFNGDIQHFMLESIVQTQDSNIYVVCSQRYQMNITSSKNIMDHIAEFHKQFIEKCEEIKRNFKYKYYVRF